MFNKQNRIKTSYLLVLISRLGEIVQWLEHWNHNPNVEGSNPPFANVFAN